MKKTTFILSLSTLMLLGTLASCGKKPSEPTSSNAPTTSVTTPDTTPNPTTTAPTPTTTAPTPTTTAPTPDTSSTAPVMIDIPRSAEADLEEKTLSYYEVEDEVNVIKAKKKADAFDFSFQNKGEASWIGFQILYKNSELTNGQAYLLKWTVHSSVAGNITVNGKKVALVAGENKIELKYVCGTDTSATTALLAQFGTAEDGFLGTAEITVMLPTYEETSLHEYTSETWEHVSLKTDGEILDGNYYWFENEPMVTIQGNPTERGNAIVKKNTDATANYNVSVKAQGTQDYPISMPTHIGMIPWYVNNDNFIIAYCDWRDNERPNGIREFQITGYINGTHVGFNDMWGDNATYAALAKPTSYESTYAFNVRTIGKNLNIDFLFNGEKLISKGFNIEGVTGTATYGLYAFGNDTVNFTDLTYEAVEVQENVHTWNIFKPGADAPTFTVNEDKSVTLTSMNSHLSNLILTDDTNASGDYTVISTIKGTANFPMTGDVYQGICPWYVDDNNYIVVYGQWCTWEDRFKNTDMREFQITGFVNGKDILWHDFWTDGSIFQKVAPSAEITFKIVKTGATFTPYFNDTPLGYWYADGDYRYSLDLSSTGGDFTTQAKVGYYMNGSTATYSDIVVSK